MCGIIQLRSSIPVSYTHRETAEKYVHKGDKLYVEGKIRTRSYDDQTGAKRYVTEIFVDSMETVSYTHLWFASI